ncbi:hypothetical protein BABINDRAFT_165545 [Babjeviella inositovora NRRL Y-12698]|uniref:RING-type domain-containing protein n=1 Tax=Babjeviella inositovora NRRL Y-12698 TaxID=984486 RepID=A0A1E3QWJ3_9ASCO|nr:uncharacterized protein BABINDRAFT_165545 [Babjeviella inositovora NRRL Y-12698]ODQ82048.1 hypothetical protein BABINDRAFT_165545 [Babjeviella inositovora NRRL Y-12698]
MDLYGILDPSKVYSEALWLRSGYSLPIYDPTCKRSQRNALVLLSYPRQMITGILRKLLQARPSPDLCLLPTDYKDKCDYTVDEQDSPYEDIDCLSIVDTLLPEKLSEFYVFLATESNSLATYYTPRFEKTHRRGRTDHCTICLLTIGAHAKIICLPCNHYYHFNCLVQWFSQNQSPHKNCPLCRFNMNEYYWEIISRLNVKEILAGLLFCAGFLIAGVIVFQMGLSLKHITVDVYFAHETIKL